MTAMNAFARPDAAWLLADTAQYDDAGNIIGTGSKIATSERLSTAIGISGRNAEGALVDIDRWMDAQTDQPALLASLPALVGLLVYLDQEAVANGALTDNPIPEGLRLTVAVFDQSARRGRCAIIGSTQGMASGGEASALRPVGTLFSPPLPRDPWPGHTFDPDQTAVDLAVFQRSLADERGIFRVGGSFEAVRVHSGGIERREIFRWDDEIGRTIGCKKRGGPNA
jgi:hypothetical protein